MNINSFKKNIQNKIKEAPSLFSSSSFILDFTEVKTYENVDLFLAEIKIFLLSKNIYFIGVSNINEKLKKNCEKSRTPILHNNRSIKNESNSCMKYDYFEGTMRSGQTLYIPDNGVVYKGHIKNDAEISADGDIIITGSLSGKAFAGCNGNRDAKIIVTNYQPFLVSIDGHILHYETANSFFGRAVMVSLNKDNSLKVELI